MELGCLQSSERIGASKMGYGKVQLDIRSAEGKAERLPELAADLVRQKVDVIVGFQTPAVQAAKQATTEIPINGVVQGLHEASHWTGRQAMRENSVMTLLYDVLTVMENE
jgi:ABC-type uncharacterized transport system substrate-binding protein